MKIILIAYIIHYVVSDQIQNITQQSKSDDIINNFLITNEERLILGQWTITDNHLIHIIITKTNTINNKLTLQITPKQNNLFNTKHDYKLTYFIEDQVFQYNTQKQLLSWENIGVDILLGNNLRGYQNFQCESNLSIEITGKINDPQKNYQFIVQSQFEPNCKVDESRIRRFTYSDSGFKAQTLSFAILITITSIIQIISSIILIKKQQCNGSIQSTTLTIILLQDVYMCLFSALLFDMYTDWIYYFLPCIICQLFTVMLDLQIKIQTQDYDQQNDFFTIAKSLLIGLLQLIVVSYLFYNVRKSQKLILLNFYLLPQILGTFWRGKRRKFNSIFIFGVCLPRTIISIYMRGCPLNWLQLRVKYDTCVYIILVFIGQVLINYLQCRYGYFLRKQSGFNYFVKPQQQHSLNECAICLSQLTDQTNTVNDLEEQIQDPHLSATINDADRNRLLMVTPCNHSFHSLCLSKWMQHKAECPLCKNVLPQII